MFRYINKIFFIFVILFINSCSQDTCGTSKEYLLTNLETIVNKVSKDSLAIDAPQWKNYDNQFTNMMIDCYPLYEESMTSCEKGLVISKCIHYYYYRYGNNLIETLAKNKENILAKIKEDPEIFIEGISQYIAETWEIDVPIDIPPQDLYSLVDETISFLEDYKKEINDISTITLFIIKCVLEGVE